MKIQINFMFLFLILLNSCSNEDDQIPVFAGEYDSNFIYHEFNPHLSIDLKFNILTDYYEGVDSIDINLDEKFDLYIEQQMPVPINSISPTNSIYPFCKLITKNSLELAEKYFIYPAGHGYTQKATWIDTLYVQQRIDNLQYWSKATEFRLMWGIPPSTFGTSFGFWFEITNPEMYVGIRMKNGSDYKYGWIKVDATSLENMRFISYAIEK
jgi:hypothetical protein